MTHLKLALFLLLLLLAGVVRELYPIRDLSEGEIQGMYQSMLDEGSRHADQFWHEWPGAPGAGYWGGGTSGEEGTRANSGRRIAVFDVNVTPKRNWQAGAILQG